MRFDGHLGVVTETLQILLSHFERVALLVEHSCKA
jgi:hypothetical protein